VKKLYPWQEPHQKRLVESLSSHGVALDSSDTGVGKTVISLQTSKDLGLTPFVLCPKSVVPSWKEHGAEHTHNYEKLRTGRTMFVKKKGKSLEWFLNRDKVLLIFDEVHRCKGDSSMQSKLLAAAKKQGYKILMLSATAFHSPLEMRSIGFALNLHNYKDWWGWCIKECGCRKGTFGGLSFNGSRRVLNRIHDFIYEGDSPMGSRIRIKDLPEGSFPDTLITADGYDVTYPELIDGIYDDMHKELEALDDKKQTDTDSSLTILLRARQQIELLKIPLFEELVNDYTSSGNSVIVFLNFKDSLTALGDRLSGKCSMSVIEGGQSDFVRKSNIDQFQWGINNVLLCMTQAGGTGLSLHDEDGDRPRVSLISPSFSAIDLKQALGRVHRATGKSASIQKIVFANDTIEMNVCGNVRAKLNNLNLINDNELNPIL
jgi:superfamily II DNA or RNA helicase